MILLDCGNGQSRVEARLPVTRLMPHPDSSVTIRFTIRGKTTERTLTVVDENGSRIALKQDDPLWRALAAREEMAVDAGSYTTTVGILDRAPRISRGSPPPASERDQAFGCAIDWRMPSDAAGPFRRRGAHGCPLPWR